MYFRFEANWEWRKAWVEVCTGRYLFLPVLWPDGRKSMLTLVMICTFLSFHSIFFNFLQALKHQSPFSSLLSVYFFLKCYFMILTFNFKTEKKWMLFEVTYHTHLFGFFFQKSVAYLLPSTVDLPILRTFYLEQVQANLLMSHLTS